MNGKCGAHVLILLLLSSFGAQGAKVYSWVDGNGMVHYTDAPPADKKVTEIDLRDPPKVGSTPRSVQVENFNALTQPDAKKEQEASRLTIELLSPEQGSTLRDNTGNIIFHGAVSPRPPAQFKVRLTLDGHAAPVVSNGLSIRVENVDRGAHNAQLELLAKDGTVLAKSKVITFYLHRARVAPAAKPTPKAN